MNNNTSPVVAKETTSSIPTTTTTPEKQKAKIPLKTILKNFLNHVDFMEGQRKEGEDLYEKEFQLLKTFSEELRNKSDYACSEGDKDVNKKKNRYKDILPYDYTRVTLSDYPGVPGSDYINANYIKGASGSNAYIACQGPLPHTVNDFWRMVVECEVQVIVMACNEQEAGKYKCECYWTEEGEDRRQYGKFYITLIKSRDICPDFLVRTIKLEWSGEQGKEESRTVCQFHYSAWPDHGIPTQVKPLLEMVRLIRDCQASETLPLLIHCSAGCGRTGTICAIDFVYGLLRSGKISHDFSLYNLVKEMRRQRIAMVQTVDQYVLCHRAVKELFLEQMRVIDSHPYENVGVDGQPLLDGGNRGGRGDRGSKGEIGMPEYETIFVKGDLDIDKVLSQRSQSVPRTIMGTSILARGERASPSTTNTTAASGEGGDEVVSSLLPATLEEFSKRPPDPKIHEPPKGPDSSNQTAPQRFKKGNLRLIQTDDGGWRLEEIEDRRRSIEYKPDLVLPGLGSPGDSNDLPKVDEVSITQDLSKSEPSLTTAANNTNNQCDKNGGISPPLPAKRPPSDRRRKKSSKGEDGGSGGGSGKEVQLLLRRPSIKRIKAFFDKSKDQDKHTAEEKENIQVDKEKETDEVLSRLPRLDNGLAAVSSSDIEGLNLSGSKSVPSSLDRKASNLSKYWPLHSRQSKNEDSQHPLKRSKSMKTGIKPISVIPILNQSSFHDYRNDPPPPSPAPFSMDKKQGSEEFIDLRKPDDGQSNNNSKFFFGDDGSKDSSKKVDLASTRADVGSSLTHHARQSSQELPVASSTADGGFLELQMAKLLARKGIDEMDAAVKGDTSGGGGRKSRGEGGNESGGGRGGRAVMVVGGGPGGGGRKSLTVLDDDAKQMLKDCQEYLHGQTEYLSVGPDPEAEHNFDPSPSSIGLQYGRSVHSSPGDTYNKYNYRSSSPGAGSLETMGSTPRTSTNYTAETSSMGGGQGHPQQQHTRVGKTRSVSSLNTTSSMLLQSSPPRSKEPSMSSRKTSKTSLDNVETISSGGGEYANSAGGSLSWRQNDTSRLSENCSEEQSSQYCQVTVDAREKISAAAKSSPGGGVNRERRNSFRKAVDRVDPASLSAADRRTYEQIWMRGEGSEDKDSSVSSGNSPRVTASISPRVTASTEGGESKNINTRTLSNYPVYANAATRTTSTAAREASSAAAREASSAAAREASSAAKDLNVAARGSGSYDNVRIPQDSSLPHEQENQYKNIPFTVEELSKEDRRQSRTSDTGATSGDIAGGYEPVNFHNLRINNEKPLDGGYNRGSKTSLLSSTSNQQDLSTRGSKSSILSSASLVAEACRDFERGGRIGLPTPSSQDSGGHKQQPVVTASSEGSSYGSSNVSGHLSGGYQNAEPQKAASSSAYPSKQSAQKKNSGGGSGGGSSSVRLPPPYQAPPPGPQYHSGVSSSQPPYLQQASAGSQPSYHQQQPSSSQIGSGGSGQAQHLSSSQSYSSRLTSQVDGTPVRSIGTPVRAPPRSSTKSSPQHHHPHPSSSRHHLPYSGASPAPGQHLPYTGSNTSPGQHHLPYTASRPASSPQQSSHVPDPYSQHTTPLSTTANNQFPPPLMPLGANQFTTVTSIGGSIVHRRNPRDTNRVRDDSYLPSRSSRDTEAGQAARQMKRNSSLVTMARTGIPDYSGLILKAGNPTASHSQQTNQPPLIVQGSRTTVQLGGGMSPTNPSPPGVGGGGHHPPGVDIDRVAAAMLTSTTSINERESAPLSQVAAHQGRQLGRSLAGVLSGAAANLKSKLVGGIAVGSSGVVGGRAAGAPSSPSPPRRKEETDSIGSLESRSITAPANLNSQDLGYPVRIKSRPQGPRDTPSSFVKKQEYL